MAKASELDRIKTWLKRIGRAEKASEAWQQKYECDRLYQNYCGRQWEGEKQKRERYVVNLFFPTVEIRKPSLMFYKPQVKVEPKAPHADDPGTRVQERADLTAATLNTYLSDEQTGFAEATYLALCESFFRFGIVECQFTADVIDNPNARKPELKETDVLGEEEAVSDPDKIPINQNLYFKYIPAKQFLTGDTKQFRLDHHDWVGYWEWQNIADLKANPNYNNTKKLKISGHIKTSGLEEFEKAQEDEDEYYSSAGMTIVYKIWDLRAKKRLVFTEDSERFLLEKPFKRLPFEDLRFHIDLDNRWFPIPPTYNWLPSQSEMNDIREKKRIHRRRAIRRYQCVAGTFPDDDEKDKLSSGEDCEVITVTRADGLKPVDDAPLDRSIDLDVMQIKEDFREISGVASEERGVPQSETATQANIIDVRGRLRESYSRMIVGNWLARIANKALHTIVDNMPPTLWIKANVDETAPDYELQSAEVGGLLKEIKKDELLTTCDISVDVEQLSPLTQDLKRQNWMQVIALLASPIVKPLLAASETLLRKTLAFYDIKSEKEIKEIMRMLGMQVVAQTLQQALGTAGGGQTGTATPPASNPMPQAGPLPSTLDIAGQIANQIPKPGLFQ